MIADIKELSGLKIAFSGVDLEQTEHRGIAEVNKNAIKILSKLGATIYLLSEMQPERIGIIDRFFIPKRVQNEIDLADIINKLKKGKSAHQIKLNDKKGKYLNKKKGKYGKILKRIKYFFKLINILIPKKDKLYEISDTQLKLIENNKRLEYLKYVSGILIVDNLFKRADRASQTFALIKPPIVNLKKNNIDFLFLGSPLVLDVKPKNNSKLNIITQIHDAISIPITSHPDDPSSTFRKLKHVKKNICIYNSEFTKNFINYEINLVNKFDHFDNIFYPLPSLSKEFFDSFIKTDPLIKKAENSKKAKQTKSKLINLSDPYILFQSSIVESKNIEFLIRAFLGSSASKSTVKLVIAGKLHDTDYSKKLIYSYGNKKNIIFTDYVDEFEKTSLYLGASLYSSSTIFEGFGIPFLDATFLKLPILATDIDTHKEIKNNLSENREDIKLISSDNLGDWVKFLDEFNFTKVDKKTKIDRINSYKFLESKLMSIEEVKYTNLIKSCI